MIQTNKHYLMFRGENSGKCVITKVQLIGMEVSSPDVNTYPETVVKFKIECENAEDALETVIKIRNHCTSTSISWEMIFPDNFNVFYSRSLSLDTYTLKDIFRTDIFVLLDYVEGEFSNKSNLELLFEIQ